jgi:hypothetical protein
MTSMALAGGSGPLLLAAGEIMTKVLFLHDIREQIGSRALLPVFGMTVADYKGARDFGS